ncbi:protein P21-like [Cucurbita moschata]|uniref:Protein P21-like n=1 Tax=Cucurbita moschata TaxID=3662 RepID=A0A6J1EC81_CUCMO|nr:protein P21-like [Cucurbita moschata]
MWPPFNQALLPFGSQKSIGSFTRSYSIGHSGGSTITILNNCPYTIWAAIIDTSRSFGSGRRLDNGEAWTLNMLDNSAGRAWGRTSCSFDGSGRGFCETGDCGRVLNCQDFGTPPLTLAEFSLNRANNLDFLDISLVDGFNIPIKFSPKTAYGCSRGASCATDVNGQCPVELRALGGYRSPCTVFKTDVYCCVNSTTKCGPTSYSRFFKTLCPDAYSYILDEEYVDVNGHCPVELVALATTSYSVLRNT